MDTRLLRTFVSIHRTGSFTATAQELAFAQSTISTQLRTLEHQLGVQLVDRSGSRAVLTAQGRTLLPLAQAVLDTVARITNAFEESDGPRTVRVAAPDTLCGHRIPQAAAILGRDKPEVRLSVSAAGTADALHALAEDATDFSLVFESESPGPGLHLERLGTERLQVVCHPGHPLNGQRSSWATLAQHPFLVLEEGCAYSDAVVGRLKMAARGEVTTNRFGSAEAARACVAAGLGLSVLPRITVQEDIDAGKLGTIAVSGLPRPHVVLVARSRHADAATDAVRAALRQVFSRA